MIVGRCYADAKVFSFSSDAKPRPDLQPWQGFAIPGQRWSSSAHAVIGGNKQASRTDSTTFPGTMTVAPSAGCYSMYGKSTHAPCPGAPYAVEKRKSLTPRAY